MFNHVFVGSDDLQRSKVFYDAIFATVGIKPGALDSTGKRLIYTRRSGIFIVTRPNNGQPAQPANGGTLTMLVESPDVVDAWHAAGVANGGTTCESPPGLRPATGLYQAYLRDPDGNKLGAYYKPKDA